jgi:hypothetical protein
MAYVGFRVWGSGFSETAGSGERAIRWINPLRRRMPLAFESPKPGDFGYGVRREPPKSGDYDYRISIALPERLATSVSRSEACVVCSRDLRTFAERKATFPPGGSPGERGQGAAG